MKKGREPGQVLRPFLTRIPSGVGMTIELSAFRLTRLQTIRRRRTSSLSHAGTGRRLGNPSKTDEENPYGTYRPHLPELLCVITDAKGKPVVKADNLKPVDEALSHAQREPTRSGMLEAVRAAQQLLQAELPPSLGPMEPFRISGA